jgi:hypothetical protein
MKPIDMFGMLAVGAVVVGVVLFATKRRDEPAPAAVQYVAPPPAQPQQLTVAAPAPRPSSTAERVVATGGQILAVAGAVVDTVSKFRSMFP